VKVQPRDPGGGASGYPDGAELVAAEGLALGTGEHERVTARADVVSEVLLDGSHQFGRH
jgi:hypothetical protein